ncbi:beta-galactosidase [Paenibacillus mendelii]|uniref:Beta-galactosidase n=1 Tax=Paenibacillus mendelii TaxID=206163 RepID=A0ABV6J2N3_9BACL|nr:beta-galactosidase [Paenibacillus mendelii]MCQ6559248.1 beta-galactosidase [Paenibacillus mendelii]
MMNTVVFYDASFPYDGQRPDDAVIDKLQSTYKVVGAHELAEALDIADNYIHVHGPYFPKQAWESIVQYLKKGKGVVHLGGGAFRKPVYYEQGTWHVEGEQTAYHRQLRIHEMLEVDADRITKLEANPDIPLVAGSEALFAIEPTYAFTLHITRTEDHPSELGSSGPMDGHIYPLLYGVSHDGRRLSAPIVLIENTKGVFAGGRWVFVNQRISQAFWESGGLDAIRDWGAYCAEGVTELWLKPNYSCYEPGEQPILSLHMQEMGPIPPTSKTWRFNLALYADGEREALWEKEISLKSSRELRIERVPVPVPVAPGFYRVVCEAFSDSGERRVLRQGFWGRGNRLLSEGERMTVNRDYFVKAGKPMPIVGMTYMASDVARKFLFMPNAGLWDADMAHMKEAGINMIRTGIWTAWRQVMFVDGHPYEEVLRSIDSFILTAKKHDLEVVFTFFAFTPEMWEGVNPYLDPRSVAAQKRLIAAVVSRHVASTNVHWDLINEPAMFDPKRLFSGPRTVGDVYEQSAFTEWLQNRHRTVRELQERWDMTPDELPGFASVTLPQPEDISFDIMDNGSSKRNGIWLDYSLFTMEMHNRWAKELTATIRSYNEAQLVTVGQDEGLGSQRPSPFFYAEAVDYTTVHSWWLMDHLLWDSIFAKTANKPNLIQETGIMYAETPNGRAKRSELEIRNILERKYAYAFAAGGAGAVQWIWNTNYYMNNVNESNIGALRADGTEKPEADVSYDYGRFMGEIGHLFTNRELEEVVVVFPYSNDFSNRRLAFDATTKLTRVLAYDMNVPFRGVGEYHLESLEQAPPKLIIVPSPHNFSREALDTIIHHVKTIGGTVLFTGPIGLDEYWRPESRYVEELGDYVLSNVMREEAIEVDGRVLPVSYGAKRIAEVNKELPESGTRATGSAAVRKSEIGQGVFIHCPLPIELNDRPETIAAVYGYALSAAGFQSSMEWVHGGNLHGVFGSKIAFGEGALFMFVSEYAYDASIEIIDPKTGKGYAFELESERTVLFAADAEGRLLSVYRGDEVLVREYEAEPVM